MHHISDVVLEIDTLMKDITDIDIVGLYQDKNHAIELSHKDGIFYVRLDGANLYAGRDGSKATSMFYDQIAQIHDDEDRGTDPDFAALREILQARNDHVKDMLAAIGHERLASSLDGISMAKEFNMKSFQNIIKHNMTTLDVLNFSNYRPSEKENEECHTCVFFAAGGFCTKMDLPVKEEMMCDWFKPLPMAEKNEEWSHVSHQEWEEAEHEEEHDHDMEGVQKDVSKDLIYTSAEDQLESPANFNTSNRKPNVIMREFVPTDASEGFQILAKNDVDEGIVEVQIVQRDGHWDVITKQRDVSDLGDPFSAVGETTITRKVKNPPDVDNTEIEKTNRVAKVAPAAAAAASSAAAPAAGRAATSSAAPATVVEGPIGGKDPGSATPDLSSLPSAPKVKDVTGIGEVGGAIAGGVAGLADAFIDTGLNVSQQMSDTEEHSVDKGLGKTFPSLKGLGFKSDTDEILLSLQGLWLYFHKFNRYIYIDFPS